MHSAFIGRPLHRQDFTSTMTTQPPSSHCCKRPCRAEKMMKLICSSLLVTQISRVNHLGLPRKTVSTKRFQRFVKKPFSCFDFEQWGQSFSWQEFRFCDKFLFVYGKQSCYANLIFLDDSILFFFIFIVILSSSFNRSTLSS